MVDDLLQVPWGLAVLGNHSEEVVCETMRRMRALWLQSCDRPEIHQGLTRSVIQSPECSADVDAFIDEQRPLLEFPRLVTLGRKLRLLRCCEISVERLHHMMTQQLVRAPASGGRCLCCARARICLASLMLQSIAFALIALKLPLHASNVAIFARLPCLGLRRGSDS